ncbi:Acetyltransferase (GNAT) domain-containing protein [Ferrimonas sediminum]|uniref:Acetyltransferase (GNAT) domain-containing protein n=1 Tax=Ferrimonas sediminum TaxID=718193 RepID=A0A1G8XIQ4_9GAMM|nr:GNAT family N-acetyltransferase [Ferrimonas sediminum]SDJ89640.1 Acetyltransferase (GNAT) domain-containing protein [Ferrimonas sediminum]
MSCPDLICQPLEVMALPLVDRFYRQHGGKDRCRRHDRVWVARRQGRMVAVARRVPLESHWVLRGLLVDDTERRQGVATELLQCLLEECDEPLWCFALSHLKPLYVSLGFQCLDTAAEPLPKAVAGALAAYRRSQPGLLGFIRS